MGASNIRHYVSVIGNGTCLRARATASTAAGQQLVYGNIFQLDLEEASIDGVF